MAAERYRLVTPGSLHATCSTTIVAWGGCSWRIAAKPTG
jgi:predicted flavoprotein YhiN